MFSATDGFIFWVSFCVFLISDGLNERFSECLTILLINLINHSTNLKK